MKKLIKNTQCRNPWCLGPLTFEEVATSICINCDKPKKDHYHEVFKGLKEKFYCCTDCKDKSGSKEFQPKLVKKLLDPNYCKKCLKKQEAKKRKIKRAQKRIGFKSIRRKKPKIWKTKPDETKYDFKPVKVIYAKRVKNVIYTKNSLKGKWSKSSSRSIAQLQKNNSIVWNPEEKSKQLTSI